MVGLLAAAMSSLDSTLNSLSALSMQDIVKGLAKKHLTDRVEVLLSKLLTVFWGSVCLVFSFFVGNVAQTVIESVNKIGSLINGPLLAVFAMGMLSRRVNGQGAVFGLIIGFICNLWLWKYAPGISWLWWNVSGFIAACVAGYAVGLAFAPPVPGRLAGTLVRRADPALPKGRSRWRYYYLVLAAYGCGILVLLTIVTFAIQLS